MKSTGWVLIVCCLSGTAFAAATGRIVTPDGAPITVAEVCEFSDTAEPHCVPVDANGGYRMEKPKRATLVARAKGFIPATIDAAPLAVPVTLQPAATLRVTVVDAKTGLPLASGKVTVNSPSGHRFGEFVPFNKAGVRISTLPPGMVFVRAEAAGYAPGGPMTVELVAGTERAVTVPMRRSSGAAR
jgi:hypothetical protein